MHLNLSSEMESFIKGKVASVFYGNATEVIRDAIRRMQTEDSRIDAWQSATMKKDLKAEAFKSLIYIFDTGAAGRN